MSIDKKDIFPWVSCAIVGIYYAFEMMQLTLGSTLSTELIKSMHLNVQEVSLFSSTYLYSCALGILPAGILLDRYPIKPLLICSLLLAILGTFLMAVSHSYPLVILGRAFTGFSSDFAFLGYFTLASKFFAGRSEALAKSFIYSMGALGCIISQAPFTLSMQYFGWRMSLFFLAAAGMLILFAIIFFIDSKHPRLVRKRPVKDLPLFRGIKSVIANPQNLYCAFYASICNLPLALMGALWGKIYLTRIEHLSALEASQVNSMIFWGAIVGSPLLGWLAGYFRQRRLMMVSAVAGAISWMTLAYAPMDMWSLSLVFFIFGLLMNAQLFSILTVSRINPKNIEATSLSIVSIANNAGGAVYQLIFAALLIFLQPSDCTTQQCLYTHESFSHIFFIIALAYLGSIGVVYFIKEKNIRHTKVLGYSKNKKNLVPLVDAV